MLAHSREAPRSPIVAPLVPLPDRGGGDRMRRTSREGIRTGWAMASIWQKLRAGVATAAIVACVSFPRPAHALCAGFTDVLQDQFCTNVTWIKNRQVTLGCTQTTYCPHDAVSRIAMAAFMNRIGNVLTPALVHAEDAGSSLDLLADTHYVCQTSELTATSYNRLLIGEGALSFDVTGLQGLLIAVVMSRNNEGWQSISGSAAPIVDAGERHHAHVSVAPVIQNEPPAPTPSSYRFALSVGRRDPGLNAVGAWSCQLQVQAINWKP